MLVMFRLWVRSKSLSAAVQVVVLGNVDAQRAVAVRIAGDARRLRQRVADAELEAVREAAIEPRLQRVVLAVADRRDQARLAGAAELLIQLAARLSAADRRPVQLAEAELIDLARADVGRLADEAPAQLLAGTATFHDRMWPRSNSSGSVKTVIGLGTGISPLPRSGSGIGGMPSAVRLTNASEFGASSSRFSTAG